MGGRQQVFAARHQAHVLKSVVHHHRQMIGRRHVLARQHHIAEQERIDRMLMAMLEKGERPVTSAAFAAFSRRA